MTYFFILFCVWFIAFFLTALLLTNAKPNAAAFFMLTIPTAVTFLFHHLH